MCSHSTIEPPDNGCTINVFIVYNNPCFILRSDSVDDMKTEIKIRGMGDVKLKPQELILN